MSVSFSFIAASKRFNSTEFAADEGPTETRPLPGVRSPPVFSRLCVFKAADELDLVMVRWGVAFTLETPVREAVVRFGDVVAIVAPLVFEAVRLVPLALTAPVLSLDCVVGAGLRVKYDLRVCSVSSGLVLSVA